MPVSTECAAALLSFRYPSNYDNYLFNLSSATFFWFFSYLHRFIYLFNINFVLVYVTFFEKVISSLLCHTLFTAKRQTSKLGDPDKAEMCSRYHIT